MTESQLDHTFSALAHPVRRAMLARLSQGDATVNELADPFDMSLPAISRHIKVLEKAGLITRAQNAQFRPCRLDTTPIQAVASWTDQYRQIWESRFDKVDAILKTMGHKKDEE